MKRYIRSPHLEVENRDGGDTILVHTRLGSRLKINRATTRFLELFQEPMSLDELGRLGSIDKAMPIFESLRKASFLIEEGHEETLSDKILQRISPGFFGASPVRLGQTKTKDLTFLGVPFDYGNHKEPGARYGPAALREGALTHFRNYRLDPNTEKPCAWHDNDLDRTLLAEITMADAGDLFIAPNEDPRTVFAKLREVVTDLVRSETLPVILGGDHSITYAALAALDRPLGVIQIDAHADLAIYYPGTEHHHGNVMSRALELEQIVGIYQVGIRGTTSVTQVGIGGRAALALSPRQLRRVGIQGFLDQMPADLEYYVSFDIDALDPTYAPGTSTPVPGGLTFEETKDLLLEIGLQKRCLGFDLVEVNPRRDFNGLTVATALELLLTFLGGHFYGRGNAKSICASQSPEQIL